MPIHLCFNIDELNALLAAVRSAEYSARMVRDVAHCDALIELRTKLQAVGAK